MAECWWVEVVAMLLLVILAIAFIFAFIYLLDVLFQWAKWLWLNEAARNTLRIVPL